ncbi:MULTISPECIES: helix-turn-helix transcriptional regulator [unclassified Pseudomonas]|uniref:helix-turn-helix transcriptional regulator n=1 Tax=unclassified Pseudomonas TaxID=196821 RepID=UPI0015B4AEF9|nr:MULTISPECIES: helix-turn-helix transcriptional regulator [unclassified Pseudomonas]
MAYGNSAPSASGYAPKVYRINTAAATSQAAAKQTKFSAFMERLERDPAHAKGLSEARSSVADALYPDDGITLKILRLKAGLTQTQLAAALETSQPHIARMEAGRQEPVMSTCRKLSKTLGVSLDIISSALERQAEINESKAKK